MKRFIDREKELNDLEREYEKDTPSFVVIYGRRRLGKTSLINKFLESHPNNIYYLASQEGENENKKNFASLVSKYVGNDLVNNPSLSWDDLFSQILSIHNETKKIIVIDEFQYLCKVNNGFSSIMQRIWDTQLSKSNVMLVLCGSLVHLMETNVLNYTSPLYGRRTMQIKLKQIPFRYYSDFFNGMNKIDTLPFYGVSGGTPKYIETINSYKDVYEAIENEVLNPNSYLYNEVEFLLNGEVEETRNYLTILKIIGSGEHKLGNIASRMNMSEPFVNRYISTLRDLDLVYKEVPVTVDNEELSKQGLYKLEDNYFNFYFKFIYPYRNELERGNTKYVLNEIKDKYVENYLSYIYEDVCRENIYELSEKDQLPFRVNKVGRYWGRACPETDIVAFDLDKENLLIGECKYSKNPKGLDVLEELEKRASSLKKITSATKVYYIIYSLSGFNETLKKEASNRDDLILIEGI
ncbi:MAG: ATP-binding protein [Coprobacillus sp.]|nr:ATP-binding protein [Coprobacillus sp.]